MCVKYGQVPSYSSLLCLLGLWNLGRSSRWFRGMGTLKAGQPNARECVLASMVTKQGLVGRSSAAIKLPMKKRSGSQYSWGPSALCT